MTVLRTMYRLPLWISYHVHLLYWPTCMGLIFHNNSEEHGFKVDGLYGFSVYRVLIIEDIFKYMIHLFEGAPLRVCRLDWFGDKSCSSVTDDGGSVSIRFRDHNSFCVVPLGQVLEFGAKKILSLWSPLEVWRVGERVRYRSALYVICSIL